MLMNQSNLQRLTVGKKERHRKDAELNAMSVTGLALALKTCWYAVALSVP